SPWTVTAWPSSSRSAGGTWSQSGSIGMVMGLVPLSRWAGRPVTGRGPSRARVRRRLRRRDAPSARARMLDQQLPCSCGAWCSVLHRDVPLTDVPFTDVPFTDVALAGPRSCGPQMAAVQSRRDVGHDHDGDEPALLRAGPHPVHVAAQLQLRERGPDRAPALSPLLAPVQAGLLHEPVGRRLPPVRAGQDLDEDAAGEIDRKSTRLNSSHVKISYAV